MSKSFWTALGAAVESVDCALDRIPAYARDENDHWRWFRYGDWGCATQVFGRLHFWLSKSGRID